MRLTYTGILNQFLRNINMVGTVDANVLADFNYHLGTRYQLMLAKLKNYRTQSTYNFLTGMNCLKTTTGVSQAIASITSSGTTATVTTAAAHGYSTNDVIAISGCSDQWQAPGQGYNGTFTITVTSTTTFTYTLLASIVADPSGSTAATPTQYFPYPPGEVTIDSGWIAVGSVRFPLQPMNDQYQWNKLNAIIIQASALPQFIFPRRDDFGIWPIPQATYKAELQYHYRDRNLSVGDFTGGTITLTQNSVVVTNGSSVFTSAMVGRWLSVTDSTVPGQGYWYRIVDYISSTQLVLYNPWPNATVTPSSYVIGETPEIPEDGHELLAIGCTADYYSGYKLNVESAVAFNNMFYTGDPNNPSRDFNDNKVAGGLINLASRYSDRDDRVIINRRPNLSSLDQKVFATRLSM